MRLRGIFILMIQLLMLMPVAVQNTAFGEQTGKPLYGGTLTMGYASDPETLNGALTTSLHVQRIAGQIFDSLMEYDFNLNPRPALAESITTSSDGKTWKISLVRNATWHDGKPFTSADVKFTIEKVLLPFHPSGKLLWTGVTVEAPDDYTIVLTLPTPLAPLYSIGFHRWFSMILPKHLYEGTDIKTNPYNLKPIGTGPFKFKEWVRGGYIVLERNEKYFKGPPYLDRIIYKIIPDAATRVAALEKREVDALIYTDTPMELVSYLKKIPGVVVTQSGVEASNPIGSVQINLRRPPFNNVVARQALMHATDRQEIMDKAFYGLADIVHSPIGKRTAWCYNPDVTKYEYDPIKANRLLDQAGFAPGPDGVRAKVGIVCEPAESWTVVVAELLRAQWRKVGINVEVQPMDRASLTQKVYVNWDFDGRINQLSMMGDPSLGVARVYTTSQILHLMSTNAGGYSNSRVDWLFDAAKTTLDRKERAKYFYEIQEICARELPMLYLWEFSNPTSFYDDWVGIPSGPMTGIDPFTYTWWKKGSTVSKEAAAQDIATAEKEIERLRGVFYDVTEAVTQIGKAKQAFETGDYLRASTLAKEATKLAQPYVLYATGVAVLAAAVIVGVFLVRRKRKTARA